MLKRKSKRGYAYYACERGAECGFMSWDVPTGEDCPKCGKSLFKKSGRGRMKPFCINELCENFLPEDKRGYYKKPAADAEASAETGEQPEAKTSGEKSATGKAAEKKAETKKSATKKTATKKTAAKKTATKKVAAGKKKGAEE
jgi:DNA topoisomerase-1